MGSRNEVFSFLNVEQHNITDFSGEKYGALDALTEREYELVNKIFHPLIRHWDVMSMDELLDFHGPFTEKIFQIINLQKNKIRILMGNIKTTINNKDFLFSPI